MDATTQDVEECPQSVRYSLRRSPTGVSLEAGYTEFLTPPPRSRRASVGVPRMSLLDGIRRLRSRRASVGFTGVSLRDRIRRPRSCRASVGVPFVSLLD